MADGAIHKILKAILKAQWQMDIWIYAEKWSPNCDRPGGNECKYMISLHVLI